MTAFIWALLSSFFTRPTARRSLAGTRQAFGRYELGLASASAAVGDLRAVVARGTDLLVDVPPARTSGVRADLREVRLRRAVAATVGEPAFALGRGAVEVAVVRAEGVPGVAGDVAGARPLLLFLGRHGRLLYAPARAGVMSRMYMTLVPPQAGQVSGSLTARAWATG